MINDSLITDQSRLEVKKLELRSRRKINADIIGQYRSSFRGSGLLFSDLRLYEPGDDIKNIHWKVTAKTGKPYVKTFEEERQLNVLLAIDISNSTNFGIPRTNHQKALEFSALITTLTQKTQDNCGLLLFGNDIVEFIKPSSKRTQFRRILSALMTQRSHDRGTNLNGAITYLRQHLKRSSVVFLISDFYATDYADSLKTLSAKHDLIGVLLADPDYENLPRVGLVEFEDAEGAGKILLDTSNERIRTELKKTSETRRAELKRIFNEASSDLIEIKDHILTPLINLMAQRARRR